MKININKKQFLTLMKLIYLGNWMANAHRTGSDNDPMLKEYEEMQKYILSLAEDFGFEKYVDKKNVGDGKYYPTMGFITETDIEDLIDEYNNDTFWGELADRLGNRDFIRKYSEDDWKKMDVEERITKMVDEAEKYDEEFSENGLDRLEVVEDD